MTLHLTTPDSRRSATWILAATVLMIETIAGNSEAALGFPDCPGKHCSEYMPQINTACKAAGHGNGEPFPVVKDGAVCTCPCSCVAEDTLLLDADGRGVRIADVNEGMGLFSPYAASHRALLDSMLMSRIEHSRVIRVTLGNGTSLLTSPNHTFVTEEERITSVERLDQGARVLGVDGMPIEIERLEEVKGYAGRLYNIITNQASAKASDHIVITNGVQSGDWSLQATHDVIKTEIDLRLGAVQTY